MESKQQTGRLGERIALEYLEREGYEILEKNWRYRRTEIDLIARDDKVLVFIEVKTVSDITLGPPERNISRRKLKLYLDGASIYMEKIDHSEEIRFDFIGILLKDPRSYDLQHIRDAYWPDWG